jgi:hypothetical protein
MLVLVFSDPCVFIFEITPAQLIEPHSVTARPTQASLCTCYVKMVYCLFT